VTFLVSVQVNDGVVLAADSASTVLNSSACAVANLYNNANKVLNLCKGLPIGAMTWGFGSIGGSSLSTVLKDFRETINKADLIASNYTIERIANDLHTYLWTRHDEAVGENSKELAALFGVIVAGYSCKATRPEQFEVNLFSRERTAPIQVLKLGDYGLLWRGADEPASRLVLGYSSILQKVLVENLGVEPDVAAKTIEIIRLRLGNFITNPVMPIQDAIELAEYMVNVTIGYTRFTPGMLTVAGPIEIAAITKHEGFKWVKRKHYYDQRLNPSD
jgi:hypothetical protein